MVCVGIDEVGRGCLAGPVVAGAVILKGPIRGLKDSKALTRPQREDYDLIIRRKALAIGLGWADAATVDRHGLTAAVSMAMEQAMAQIELPYDEIVIDCNFNFLSNRANVRTLIKADVTVPAVSAASVVAKVARDNYMAGLAGRYPNYGFENHVGYATSFHLEMLKLHGPSDLHRRSFQPIKSLWDFM